MVHGFFPGYAQFGKASSYCVQCFWLFTNPFLGKYSAVCNNEHCKSVHPKIFKVLRKKLDPAAIEETDKPPLDKKQRKVRRLFFTDV